MKPTRKNEATPRQKYDGRMRFNQEASTVRGLSDDLLLSLLAQGFTEIGIASTYNVRRFRISYRLNAIYRRLNARTAAQAVALWLGYGGK